MLFVLYILKNNYVFTAAQKIIFTKANYDHELIFF